MIMINKISNFKIHEAGKMPVKYYCNKVVHVLWSVVNSDSAFSNINYCEGVDRSLSNDLLFLRKTQ